MQELVKIHCTPIVFKGFGAFRFKSCADLAQDQEELAQTTTCAKNVDIFMSVSAPDNGTFSLNSNSSLYKCEASQHVKFEILIKLLSQTLSRLDRGKATYFSQRHDTLNLSFERC